MLIRRKVYLWRWVHTKKKVPVLEKIPVVKDFLDVFLEELLELSTDKEIEFGINVPQLFKKKGTIGWRKFEDEFS